MSWLWVAEDITLFWGLIIIILIILLSAGAWISFKIGRFNKKRSRDAKKNECSRNDET